MKLCFPSHEFDDAVAAVCHGSASDEQARALNELLRSASRCTRRIHSARRIAFATGFGSGPLRRHDTAGGRGIPIGATSAITRKTSSRFDSSQPARRQVIGWAVTLAACVALLASGWWGWREWRQDERKGATSKAVAMLNRVVDAQWSSARRSTATGSTSGPGLASAQIGFGAGGLLQRCAGGDRGAGRTSDHFTQRRFLPHWAG